MVSVGIPLNMSKQSLFIYIIPAHSHLHKHKHLIKGCVWKAGCVPPKMCLKPRRCFAGSLSFFSYSYMVSCPLGATTGCLKPGSCWFSVSTGYSWLPSYWWPQKPRTADPSCGSSPSITTPPTEGIAEHYNWSDQHFKIWALGMNNSLDDTPQISQ